MEKHGKLIFRTLKDSDLGSLLQFCEACKKLEYHNNKSLSAIKLDQMQMPHGQYFIGYDTEKDIIFSLCGIHRMNEFKENSYRAFYRGATLPGYTTGKSGSKSSYQLMIILNMQIDFILAQNKNAEFYFTTNIQTLKSNGKSQRMNSVMAPRVSRNGIFDLVDESFIYMHTLQKLWHVNVNAYKNWRLA